MNLYLTVKQEDKIYQQVTELFEKSKGEYTHCETNYIFDERNYYDMYTENEHYNVTFKTKNGNLLKRSVSFEKLDYR